MKSLEYPKPIKESPEMRAFNIGQAFWRLCFFALSLFITGCAIERVVEAPEDPALQSMQGKQFILKLDCYVFHYTDKRRKYPFIGPLTRAPSTHVPGLPFAANPRDIGKDLGDEFILGIIPKGTKFHVVNLTYTKKHEIGRTASFLIVLDDETLAGRWPVLDGFWITNNNMRPPPRLREQVVGVVGESDFTPALPPVDCEAFNRACTNFVVEIKQVLQEIDAANNADAIVSAVDTYLKVSTEFDDAVLEFARKNPDVRKSELAPPECTDVELALDQLKHLGPSRKRLEKQLTRFKKNPKVNEALQRLQIFVAKTEKLMQSDEVK